VIEQPVELKISQPFEFESGKGIGNPVLLRRQPAGRKINVVESSCKKEKLKRVDSWKVSRTRFHAEKFNRTEVPFLQDI